MKIQLSVVQHHDVVILVRRIELSHDADMTDLLHRLVKCMPHVLGLDADAGAERRREDGGEREKMEQGRREDKKHQCKVGKENGCTKT